LELVLTSAYELNNKILLLDPHFYFYFLTEEKDERYSNNAYLSADNSLIDPFVFLGIWEFPSSVLESEKHELPRSWLSCQRTTVDGLKHKQMD